MFDRGLHLTLEAMRRQLAGMPTDLYLIRLIQLRELAAGHHTGHPNVHEPAFG
jgi:hypothetical protein